MSFIVVVQDYGEIYRYAHSTLEDAKRYMAEVNLPCRLEIVDDTTNHNNERSTYGD